MRTSAFGVAALAFSASALEIIGSDVTGTILYTIDGSESHYVLPSPADSDADATIPYSGNASYLVFTSFVANSSSISASFFQDAVKNYLAEDDVFTKAFLQNVYLTCESACSLDQSAINYLENKSITVLAYSGDVTVPPSSSVSSVKGSGTPSKGPLLAVTTGDFLSLYKVYSTFPDYYRAFMWGVVPSKAGGWTAFNFWNAGGYEHVIPFPSRLYSAAPSADKPLSGVRFVVKDIIEVKGAPTSGGSREYLRLYNQPNNVTAPCIQRLLDLGAVYLGKVKAATFAIGEWPDQNWSIDYSYNPRADGALGLSSSSYGSASAIASYGQIDMAVGTDTLGSVRNPADRVGVYGLRPSHGAMSVENVIPSAPTLDTIGFFARDPWLTKRVQNAWYDVENNAVFKKGNFSLPKKLINPVDVLHVNNTPTLDAINGFLSNVADTLGMSIEKINVTSVWEQTVEYNGTIGDWISNTTSVTAQGAWDLVGKKYIADYKAAFNGSWPDEDSGVRSSWARGEVYTAEMLDANTKRKNEFKDFFHQSILPYSEETCTEGIFIYQIADTGGGVPEYRDRALDYFPDFFPFRPASIGPLAEVADITVPFGELAYESQISHKDEQLILTVSMVAASGCDKVLLDFVEAMADKGLIKIMKTGQLGF